MNKQLLPKPKKTKKKFYNKWIYRSSFDIPGYSISRYYRSCDLEKFLESPISDNAIKYIWSMERLAKSNRHDVLRFHHYITSLDNTTYQIRLEKNQVDFYTNDCDLYNEILQQFSDCCINRYEPSDDLILEDGKITVNKFPHDKYKYKVFLKPHTLKNHTDEKQQYIDWLKGQKERIYITSSTITWFMNTTWNWDRRYMYIADDQTLLLTKLRNSSVLGRIYEYKIPDK